MRQRDLLGFLQRAGRPFRAGDRLCSPSGRGGRPSPSPATTKSTARCTGAQRAPRCPANTRGRKPPPLLQAPGPGTAAPWRPSRQQSTGQKLRSDNEAAPGPPPRPPFKAGGWGRGGGEPRPHNGPNRLRTRPRSGPPHSRPEVSHTHWKAGPGPGPGPAPGIRRVSQGFGGGGGWDAISSACAALRCAPRRLSAGTPGPSAPTARAPGTTGRAPSHPPRPPVRPARGVWGFASWNRKIGGCH